MLPLGCEVLETVVPLDKRARNSGRALLRLRLCHSGGTAEVASALHQQHVGGRRIEARSSDLAELAFERRQLAAIVSRADALAPQAYCRHSAPAVQPPSDLRDIVVVCSVPPAVAAARFELNDLPKGRVDVLARLASAALFLSFGVRKAATVWLVLSGTNLTLRCCGATAKGLHPDERTFAIFIRRTLLSRSAGDAPAGWSAVDGDRLDMLLPQLLTRGSRLVVLHEEGEPISETLNASEAEGTVVVVGGHQGFRKEDEAAIEECIKSFGGVKASVGPVPLLASHCIVLAHAALDQHYFARQRQGKNDIVDMERAVI